MPAEICVVVQVLFTVIWKGRLKEHEALQILFNTMLNIRLMPPQIRQAVPNQLV